MIWKRRLLALIALGGAMVAGSAQAGDLACWTFEFVPGERMAHQNLGPIQNGHLYYSDVFQSGPAPIDREALSELFEAHVRKTTPRKAANSVYLSGCEMTSSDHGAKYNAMTAHDRFLRESYYSSTDLHWTPSAEDLAKAAFRRRPVYMQCVATSYSPRFDKAGAFHVGPVFEPRGDDFHHAVGEFRDYLRANGIDANGQCFSALNPGRLKALLIDEIDHSKPGSPVTQITFMPSGAVAAPPPKKAEGEAPKAPSLTVKTDTSAKDAAKAWDEQVKKTLAAEAQKKVETAAKALRDDAEMKRKIAEFMAERRRQGAAQ